MRFFAVLIMLFFFSLHVWGQNKKAENIELIKMERGACFGSCPIYVITINMDGLAVYEGERFVEKIGTYKKKLSKAEINKLVKQFNKAGIFKFNDNYPSRATDFPETVISYNYKNKSKKIQHSNIVPEELVRLELLIEKIAEAKGWQKVEEIKN